MATGTSAMQQRLPKSERRRLAAAAKVATGHAATEAEAGAAYMEQLVAEVADGPAASLKAPRAVVEAFMRDMYASFPA